MRRIRKYLTSKPHVAVAVPAILASIAFMSNFFKALSDGHINSVELHELTGMAEGFSATLFFVLAIFLKNKNK